MTTYNGLQTALNTLLEEIQTKPEASQIKIITLKEYLNKKYADIENDRTATPLDKYQKLKTCWKTDLIVQFRELADAVDIQEIENIIKTIDANLESKNETKAAEPLAKICRSPGLFSIPPRAPDEDKEVEVDAFTRGYQKLKEAIKKYCSDIIENSYEMLFPENVNVSLNIRFKKTLKRYYEQEVNDQRKKKIQLTYQEFQNILIDQFKNKFKRPPTEKEYITEIRQAFFYKVYDRKLIPSEYEIALEEEFKKQYIDNRFRYVIPAEAAVSIIETRIQKIEAGKPALTPAERFEALATYWRDHVHPHVSDKIIKETIEELENELYEFPSPRAYV